MMTVFIPGSRFRQNGSVKLLRGSFQPQTCAESKLSIISLAFSRNGSNSGRVKVSSALGGRSQAPPSALSNSSFSATKPRCSQKPSGLSACGGINAFFGPRKSPQACNSRVSIDVPERCAPAMQIAVWVLALLFTQRPYTTTTRWVRQDDCCARVPTANVDRRKSGPHLRCTSMQRNDGRKPDEIRPINFELHVAPHASGSVLVSMGKTRVICAVTI